MTGRLTLPVLDAAAHALRSTGSYRADFGVADVRPLLLVVINRLLTEYAQVRAELLALDVRIGHSQGIVAGALKVLSPVKAVISPLIILGNGAEDRKSTRLNSSHVS